MANRVYNPFTNQVSAGPDTGQFDPYAHLASSLQFGVRDVGYDVAPKGSPYYVAPATQSAPTYNALQAQQGAVAPSRASQLKASIGVTPAPTQVSRVQVGSAIQDQHAVGDQRISLLQTQHNELAKTRASNMTLQNHAQLTSVTGSLHGTAQDWVTRVRHFFGVQ